MTWASTRSGRRANVLRPNNVTSLAAQSAFVRSASWPAACCCLLLQLFALGMRLGLLLAALRAGWATTWLTWSVEWQAAAMWHCAVDQERAYTTSKRGAERWAQPA
eukprot:362080-Chlamydomonas_euryale.AAC.7